MQTLVNQYLANINRVLFVREVIDGGNQLLCNETSATWKLWRVEMQYISDYSVFNLLEEAEAYQGHLIQASDERLQAAKAESEDTLQAGEIVYDITPGVVFQNLAVTSTTYTKSPIEEDIIEVQTLYPDSSGAIGVRKVKRSNLRRVAGNGSKMFFFNGHTYRIRSTGGVLVSNASGDVYHLKG